MNAAKLDTSYRLRRVLAFLRLGPGTTYQISRACEVCAVNSIISELRANGFAISCKPVKGQRGVYLYTLLEEPA